MTRYEAAVLAYRAVDMIEAQITANKAVAKADIDAANKLIAAFGAELKTVERHVDALQQEADATQSRPRYRRTASWPVKAAQIGALNDFNRRAQITRYGHLPHVRVRPEHSMRTADRSLTRRTHGAAANGVQTYCANTGRRQRPAARREDRRLPAGLRQRPAVGQPSQRPAQCGPGLQLLQDHVLGQPEPERGVPRRNVRLGPHGHARRNEHADDRLYSVAENYLNGNAGQAATLRELLGRQREPSRV